MESLAIFKLSSPKLVHSVLIVIYGFFHSLVFLGPLVPLSVKKLLDTTVFIIHSLDLLVTGVQLVLKHEPFSLGLLRLLLEDLDLVYAIHNTLLDHLNSSLEPSVLPSQSLYLHLLLPLEHMACVHLRYHSLYLFFSLDSLLFKVSKLGFQLRFKKLELLDVSVAFLNVAFEGHEIFIFLPV